MSTPINSLYEHCRQIYWRLPPPLRAKLYHPARKLSQVFSSKTSNSLPALTRTSDLTWDQFRENVLEVDSGYQGVFIQDLTIDWDVDLYQRPQHMCKSLADLGYLVIYITGNWGNDNVSGFRQVHRNVWLTNENVVGRIPGAFVSIYSTSYAGADRIMADTNRNYTLFYEYIDHIDPKISGAPEVVARLSRLKEYAFSGGADFIVASSQALYDEAVAAVGTDKTLFIRNGVDTLHYRSFVEPLASHHELSLFAKRHKHIVGYFGALAPWLWYDLINEVTRRRPDLGFVFIGPDYYGGSQSIEARDNVILTGPIDYKILPRYAALFDICIIPFEPGEIAQTTSPLKLFEYFALEKPVVVTSDMRECTVFDVVHSAGDVDEFIKKLDEAIHEASTAKVKQTLSGLADANSWDERAKVYVSTFEAIRN